MNLFRSLTCCSLLGALVCLLPACQSTHVTTVWKSPDAPPAQPFTKIAAIVVNATPGERRAAEDQLVSEIKRSEGIPGYSLITDDDLKDKDKAKASLKSRNIDGAIVLRLVSTDKTSVYKPRNITPSSDVFAYSSAEVYTRGYTVTTTTVRAEISIYAVNDEKLLWTGSSSTNDPANVRDLIHQIAQAAAEELRAQGMIK